MFSSVCVVPYCRIIILKVEWYLIVGLWQMSFFSATLFLDGQKLAKVLVTQYPVPMNSFVKQTTLKPWTATPFAGFVVKLPFCITAFLIEKLTRREGIYRSASLCQSLFLCPRLYPLRSLRVLKQLVGLPLPSPTPQCTVLFLFPTSHTEASCVLSPGSDALSYGQGFS